MKPTEEMMKKAVAAYADAFGYERGLESRLRYILAAALADVPEPTSQEPNYCYDPDLWGK